MNKVEPLVEKRNQLKSRLEDLHNDNYNYNAGYEEGHREMSENESRQTAIWKELEQVLTEGGESNNIVAFAKKVVESVKDLDDNERNAVLSKRAQRLEKIAIYRNRYPGK